MPSEAELAAETKARRIALIEAAIQKAHKDWFDWKRPGLSLWEATSKAIIAVLLKERML